jgi:hypothetical protein
MIAAEGPANVANFPPVLEKAGAVLEDPAILPTHAWPGCRKNINRTEGVGMLAKSNCRVDGYTPGTRKPGVPAHPKLVEVSVS